MFSSHCEKQIIAFTVWELVLEEISSTSPRTWHKSRQGVTEDEVVIFVSRVPCSYCDDLCQKTNAFYGTNIKLVFINRVQKLADRCKCTCLCDMPPPEIIIKVPEDPNPPVLETSATQLQIKQKSKHKRVNPKSASLPDPEDTPKIPPKRLSKPLAIETSSASEDDSEVDGVWSTSTKRSQKLVAKPEILTYGSSESPLRKAKKLKARPSSLDPDDNSGEWKPTPNLKRKLLETKSEGTVTHKRQRIVSFENPSTEHMSDQIAAEAPLALSASPFSKWTCSHSEASSTKTALSRTVTRETNPPKIAPAKPNTVKITSSQMKVPPLIRTSSKATSLKVTSSTAISSMTSPSKTAPARTTLGKARLETLQKVGLTHVEHFKVTKVKQKPGRPKKQRTSPM